MLKTTSAVHLLKLSYFSHVFDEGTRAKREQSIPITYFNSKMWQIMVESIPQNMLFNSEITTIFDNLKWRIKTQNYSKKQHRQIL